MSTEAIARQRGKVEFLNPDGLHSNPALSNVAVVSGPVRTIYVGGQNAVLADGTIVGKDDLAAQTRQILANLDTALAAAGARLEDSIKWNLLVVEGQELGPGFAVYREVWGDRGDRPPPLVTAAFVKALAHPDFLLEIDAIAVVPEAA